MPRHLTAYRSQRDAIEPDAITVQNTDRHKENIVKEGGRGMVKKAVASIAGLRFQNEQSADENRVECVQG